MALTERERPGIFVLLLILIMVNLLWTGFWNIQVLYQPGNGNSGVRPDGVGEGARYYHQDEGGSH